MALQDKATPAPVAYEALVVVKPSGEGGRGRRSMRMGRKREARTGCERRWSARMGPPTPAPEIRRVDFEDIVSDGDGGELRWNGGSYTYAIVLCLCHLVLGCVAAAWGETLLRLTVSSIMGIRRIRVASSSVVICDGSCSE